MAKSTFRIIPQDDKSYAVQMGVGRSVRTIAGFPSEDDARRWAARANLQEIHAPGGIANPSAGSGRPSKSG